MARAEHVLMTGEQISRHLDEIRELFADSDACKATVIIRNPPYDGTRDICIGNDDPDEVVNALRYLVEKGDEWA